MSSATELKQKGTELVRLGKHQEAVKAYTDAIKLNPTDVHLYHSNLSMCYHALNDAPNAEKAARKAIEAKPEWAKGHARLGNALLLAAKPAEAVAAYAAGLAVEPANVSLLELMMKAQSSLTGAPPPDAAAAAAAAASPLPARRTPRAALQPPARAAAFTAAAPVPRSSDSATERGTAAETASRSGSVGQG